MAAVNRFLAGDRRLEKGGPMSLLRDFMKDESGQGTTEYAIIVVLIAVALIGTLMLFKSTLIAKFNEIINSVRNAR